MADWDEIDERDGMPVHVRMGLTKDGQGPADPPDPDFDHWGCWCDDVSCPGPPQCTATSWPFTPNDTRCIMVAGHPSNGHRDINGFEWGGDDDRPPRIFCPRCGRGSTDPNDIREGYCGNCHDWTSKPPQGETL